MPLSQLDELSTSSSKVTFEESMKPTKSSSGFIPILKNRHFLLLWISQVFSQLADKIYLVLMIVLIESHFTADPHTISSWGGAIMIANTIPAVLFGSLAGVYVGRWSKKGVLVVSNLIRGMLVLTIPLLLWLIQDKITLLNFQLEFITLFVITFIISTFTQFFAPAEQATIPLIVKPNNLLSANSLFTTTMMGSLIIGFALGSPLLELAGNWHIGKEFVVGSSYIIAGFLLLLLQTGEKTIRHPQEIKEESNHVLQDIRSGIIYLQKNHTVGNALIQLIILFCIFAALAVLALSIAEQIPTLKAEQFGFLLAASGVGMAGSAAILGQWGEKFSPTNLSFWGLMGVAGSLVGLSFYTHQLGMTLFMTALLGWFGAFVGIPMQTTIQAETPEDMRGKVFGLQNNAVNIALSLPLALAGVAENWFGLEQVLLGLAILALVGGILTWYISERG